MLKSKREYIEDCARKEDHLRARKLASPAELDEFRPASRNAPKEAWVFWWAQLVGYARRQETRELGFGHEDADTIAVMALNGTPMAVLLRPATESTPALVVEVYPKSFHVLFEFFHTRDSLITYLADRVEAIRQAHRIDDFPLLERAAAELSYQMRLMAWAACTPGHDLPFGLDDTEIALPEPFVTLLPPDLLRINETFMQVNAGLLSALDRLVAPGKPGGASQAPTWSIFFGQLAMRIKRPAERLMREHTLAQLLATVKLSAPQDDAEAIEELTT